MRLVTHTLTDEAVTSVRSRRVPTPAAVRAAARPVCLRSDRTRPSVVERGIVEHVAYDTTGHFASLHGAIGRVGIPTNARRRPQETPT